MDKKDPTITPGPPSSLDIDRLTTTARSGVAQLETGFAGDVDADALDATTVGDEAPGGDNSTPDQDIVDEIGRALGVEYQDNQELRGGGELEERDRHRWELDPASSEDFKERTREK